MFTSESQSLHNATYEELSPSWERSFISFSVSNHTYNRLLFSLKNSNHSFPVKTQHPLGWAMQQLIQVLLACLRKWRRESQIVSYLFSWWDLPWFQQLVYLICLFDSNLSCLVISNCARSDLYWILHGLVLYRKNLKNWNMLDDTKMDFVLEFILLLFKQSSFIQTPTLLNFKNKFVVTE